jgi:deazaflavin-dependent oxidoreductase (nitroreductase family)
VTDTITFEDMLIADMRANDGRVTQGPLAGHPLLVLTNRGARSGEPRTAILTWSRDGDDFIVAGTAGGSPTTPGWVHNLRVHPDVSIEAENRTFTARATVIDGGDERDRLWDQHVAALPHFAGYLAKVTRLIPMVRLTPTSAPERNDTGTARASERT